MGAAAEFDANFEYTFEDSETYVNKLYKKLFPAEKPKAKKRKSKLEYPL